MSEARSTRQGQDGHPVRIGIVNLMPNKEQTELQFIRLFEGCSQVVTLVWIRMLTHVSRHTSQTYLESKYVGFEEALEGGLEGVIITGAPVEQLPFEAVDYWEELKGTFESLRVMQVPALFICWASQAALRYFYGIEKGPLEQKMFGIFAHQVLGEDPLLEGVGAPFFAPHSRHTANDDVEVSAHPQIQVLLKSEIAGILMSRDRQYPFYYISGHMEYDLRALDREYWRDVRKGLDIPLPKAYYVHNDPALGIEDTWQASAARLADRWITHRVITRQAFKNVDREAHCGCSGVV